MTKEFILNIAFENKHQYMSRSVKPLVCGRFPIYQKHVFSEEVLYNISSISHFTDLRQQRRISEIVTLNRLKVQEQTTTILAFLLSLKNVIFI